MTPGSRVGVHMVREDVNHALVAYGPAHTVGASDQAGPVKHSSLAPLGGSGCNLLGERCRGAVQSPSWRRRERPLGRHWAHRGGREELPRACILETRNWQELAPGAIPIQGCTLSGRPNALFEQGAKRGGVSRAALRGGPSCLLLAFLPSVCYPSSRGEKGGPRRGRGQMRLKAVAGATE